MKKTLRAFAVPVLIFIFSLALGCVQNKLVGDWQEVDNPNHTLVIEKNGDNFLMSETHDGLFKRSSSPVAGTYKGGIITFPPVMGTSPTVYFNEKTGQLILTRGLGPLSSETAFEKKK